MDKGKRPVGEASSRVCEIERRIRIKEQEKREAEWRKQKVREYRERQTFHNSEAEMGSRRLRMMKDREDKRKAKAWVPTKLEHDKYGFRNWALLGDCNDKCAELAKSYISEDEYEARVEQIWAEYEDLEEARFVAGEEEVDAYVRFHEERVRLRDAKVRQALDREIEMEKAREAHQEEEDDEESDDDYEYVVDLTQP